MSSARGRQTFVIGTTLAIVMASIALALPAGASMRHAISPQLPLIVLVSGTLIGAWQLVTGIIGAIANGGVRASDAVPLSLGVSALFMALACLPSDRDAVPHLYAVVGAAIFAVAAAVLQRRSGVRPEL